MNKTVSVIITTYNDADYLKRSIRSVIEQTAPPLELLIIDDGSEDDKAELITNDLKTGTSIQVNYFKKLNGGPSSARNYGIKKAKGDFIIFLDSDDELVTESIEWRIKEFSKLDNNYGLIYGTELRIYENKNDEIENINIYNGLLLHNTRLIGRINGIPGQVSNYIFHKYILKAVKGFNEELKFNEDFEILLKIAKKWKFYGVNKIGFKRYIRNDSWSKKNPYKSYEGVEEFLSHAKINDLLDKDEIQQRKKENRLSLVKVLIKQRKPWKEISPFIDEAFLIKKPINLKELLLFAINKFMSTFVIHVK